VKRASKLMVYFGESDRVGGHLLSDGLLDLFEQHRLHAAVLVRGIEGFGGKQSLRTDRLLTLSEDLPLVAVAVDEPSRIEALLPVVTGVVGDGLVTLESARLLHGRLAGAPLPEELHEATKLTVYLGRDERIGRRPAFIEIVRRLHGLGVAGATVLLGVDGMAHGERRRARFFSRNDTVPLMVVSVGSGETIASALPLLDDLLTDPIMTLERVRVCKRDGVLLAQPRHPRAVQEPGRRVWQKLTVYAAEQARSGTYPLHVDLMRRLRTEGASGATCVRGVWGFSGDHRPHGDRLFHVRRRVPVVTSVVDTPERIQQWFRIVDEVTADAGLVTSELVPTWPRQPESAPPPTSSGKYGGESR
jgi:PII-like signaling protein